MTCSGSIFMSSFLSTVSGDDFVPDSTLSITFAATSSSGPIIECASVDIQNDNDVECFHSFTVEVGDIMCATDPPITSTRPNVIVEIKDDDGNIIILIAAFNCEIISQFYVLKPLSVLSRYHHFNERSITDCK